jgi:hypothetical protein
MNFAEQIEYNRRLLVEDIFRRLEAALQPVADALNDFFAVLFSRRLPADWREQWHAFIAEQEAAGYRVEPQSVREFEDWIEAWARYCELLPVAETSAVSAAKDANDLLVPKMTTTQTVPRYRNGRIVGGVGGDVSAGQSLSEAVPIFFEVAVTVGGVFFEPLDWALTAREIWNDPTSGWSYAGLIPFVPAGAGKIGKASARFGNEAVYGVGIANDLRKVPVQGTQIHHVPQTREAESLIGAFNSANKAGNEAAIRLPISEHGAVSAAQAARKATSSARDLLSDDIRILRNNTDAPNSQLLELIDIIKNLHLSDFAPLQRRR